MLWKLLLLIQAAAITINLEAMNSKELMVGIKPSCCSCSPDPWYFLIAAGIFNLTQNAKFIVSTQHQETVFEASKVKEGIKNITKINLGRFEDFEIETSLNITNSTTMTPGEGYLVTITQGLGFNSALLADIKTQKTSYTFELFFTGTASSQNNYGFSPVISFGEPNLTRFSQNQKKFTYVNLSSSDWEITLNSFCDIDANEGTENVASSLSCSKVNAIIDSSSPYIHLPDSYYNNITKILPFTEKEELLCNNKNLNDLPTYYINMDELSIPIRWFYYIARSNDDKKCISLFKKSPDNKIRLGVPFLQNAYVQFDWVNKRMGIALSRNIPEVIQISNYIEVYFVSGVIAMIIIISALWYWYYKRRSVALLNDHEVELLQGKFYEK